MKYDFDIIVIGSGPAGSKVAEGCAKEEKKVAVADYLYGGTCALRGCTPKKAMESVTSLWWKSKVLSNSGFPHNGAPIDWKKLMAHKSQFTALVPQGTKDKFKRKDIKVLQGKASFEDAHTLSVNDKKYTAQKIVIATGSTPTKLPIDGFEHLCTSEDFFELDHLPERVVFVGGGYIAFELAHIAAACGSQVTILGKEQQPLPAFDPQLSDKMAEATLQKGIDLRLGFEVKSVEKTETGYLVKTNREGNDKYYEFEGDVVFHAAGRQPQTQSLQLENTGITTDKTGAILVNKYFQTKKHKHVFALGDVIGNLPFTEICGYESQLVTNNILHPKKKKKANYDGFPIILFTTPKLTAVGKSEKALKEKGIDYEVHEANYEGHLIQRAVQNQYAEYRIFTDKKTNKILGAHVLGYKADDVINVFALAIQNGIRAEALRNTLLGYPTATQLAKHMAG